MLLTIYDTGTRRVIGEILNNRTFKKEVYKSKHLFRKLDAWGFDYRALVDYILPQADFIFIHDKEDGLYYYVPAVTLGKVNEDGKFIAGPNIEIRHYNRNGQDSGVQVFLSRRYWQKFNKPEFNKFVD